MNPQIPGFGLILLAAVAGGAFAFPLRVHKQYAWENTWLLAFFFALICIPFTVVTIFPSGVEAGGGGSRTRDGDGRGRIRISVGVGGGDLRHRNNSVGMSLGYATIMGLATAVGSYHSDDPKVGSNSG